MRVDYHRLAMPGPLLARGRLLRLGRTIATSEATVIDEHNNIVASGRAAFLVGGDAGPEAVKLPARLTSPALTLFSSKVLAARDLIDASLRHAAFGSTHLCCCGPPSRHEANSTVVQPALRTLLRIGSSSSYLRGQKWAPPSTWPSLTPAAATFSLSSTK